MIMIGFNPVLQGVCSGAVVYRFTGVKYEKRCLRGIEIYICIIVRT